MQPLFHLLTHKDARSVIQISAAPADNAAPVMLTGFFRRMRKQKYRQSQKGQATGNVINVQAFAAFHTGKINQEYNRYSGWRNNNCGEMGESRGKCGQKSWKNGPLPGHNIFCITRSILLPDEKLYYHENCIGYYKRP
jgi:hypothetical protein